MRVRISTFALLLILVACSPTAKSIDPERAQARLNAAWRQPQHTIWEIEGTTMPLGGALTVESWRAGERFRFEILESPAPALVGEMLIVDGATAWQHNRFREAAPAPITDPWLSPLSDLVAMIEQRWQQPPLAATERSRPLNSGPAQEIELRYAGGQYLTMTLDETSGLPVRLRLVTGPAIFEMTARTFAPLTDPPAGLFRPIPYTEINLKSKLLRWASFGDVGARQLEPKLLWPTTASSSCLAPTDRSIGKFWFHPDLSIAYARLTALLSAPRQV